MRGMVVEMTWCKTVGRCSCCCKDALLLLASLRQEPPLLSKRICRPSPDSSSTDTASSSENREMAWSSAVHSEQR